MVCADPIQEDGGLDSILIRHVDIHEDQIDEAFKWRVIVESGFLVSVTLNVLV